LVTIGTVLRAAAGRKAFNRKGRQEKAAKDAKKNLEANNFTGELRRCFRDLFECFAIFAV